MLGRIFLLRIYLQEVSFSNTKCGYMYVKDYWNQIGASKHFEDPVYVHRLKPYLTLDSSIVEYGCGYGRMLRILKSFGYEKLFGFDFAENMIVRGKKENPDLDLRLLEHSNRIPFEDESIGGVVMSTVLCSMVEAQEKRELISEILRVLKRGGVLYLTDFLLCDHPSYQEKYTQGKKLYGKWGMYQSSEGLIVCHYSSSEILDLLRSFDIQWFEQFDFKTMNQNPARTFHCIGKKPKI